MWDVGFGAWELGSGKWKVGAVAAKTFRVICFMWLSIGSIFGFALATALGFRPVSRKSAHTLSFRIRQPTHLLLPKSMQQIAYVLAKQEQNGGPAGRTPSEGTHTFCVRDVIMAKR